MDIIFKNICAKGTFYNDKSPRYNEAGAHVICDRCKREHVTEYKGLEEYEYDLCIPCVDLINHAMCNRESVQTVISHNTCIQNKKPLTEHEQLLAESVYDGYRNRNRYSDLTLMEQDMYECDHETKLDTELKLLEAPKSESMSRMEQKIYERSLKGTNDSVTRMEQGMYSTSGLTRMEQGMYSTSGLTRMEQGIYNKVKYLFNQSNSEVTRMEQNMYREKK